MYNECLTKWACAIVLRCKTPAMVRKEIWMHRLAYNLIRTVMAESAEHHKLKPREVRFTVRRRDLLLVSTPASGENLRSGPAADRPPDRKTPTGLAAEIVIM